MTMTIDLPTADNLPTSARERLKEQVTTFATLAVREMLGTVPEPEAVTAIRLALEETDQEEISLEEYAVQS